MKLAHPRRCAADPSDSLKLLRAKIAPDAWQKIAFAFSEDRLTSEIVQDLGSDSGAAELDDLFRRSMAPRSTGDSAVAYAALLCMRHAMHPQPYFVIDDALVKTLESTDLDPDIPVSMLSPPHKRLFIEFGSRRECSVKIMSSSAGLHTLEGAYIEWGSSRAHGEGIFVLLMGSPVGKSSSQDVAAYSVFIPLAEKKASIEDALLDTIDLSQGGARKASSVTKSTCRLDPEFTALLFMAKALLYIQMPEAKLDARNDRSAWVAATSGLETPAKREKAARNGAGLVDYVLVSGPPPKAPVDNLGEIGETKVTPRRAQLSMKTSGRHRTLQRVVFSPDPPEDLDGLASAPTVAKPTLH